MESKRLDLIDSVIAHVGMVLKRHGITEDSSAQIAVQVADELIDVWGGQNLTFPTDYRRKFQKREAEVLSKFNGFNYADLAREYGVTERGMRKLINRARERHKKASH